LLAGSLCHVCHQWGNRHYPIAVSVHWHFGISKVSGRCFWMISEVHKLQCSGFWRNIFSDFTVMEQKHISMPKYFLCNVFLLLALLYSCAAKRSSNTGNIRILKVQNVGCAILLPESTTADKKDPLIVRARWRIPFDQVVAKPSYSNFHVMPEAIIVAKSIKNNLRNQDLCLSPIVAYPRKKGNYFLILGNGTYSLLGNQICTAPLKMFVGYDITQFWKNFTYFKGRFPSMPYKHSPYLPLKK